MDQTNYKTERLVIIGNNQTKDFVTRKRMYVITKGKIGMQSFSVLPEVIGESNYLGLVDDTT